MRQFLLLAACLIGLQVSAQFNTAYSFTHYGMVDGLASNEVFSIVQDKTGYMWIATNNGLQRFDGVHYKTFRHQDNNPQSVPSNVITKLLIDAKDNLWLVTNDGDVGMFDKNSFTFQATKVVNASAKIVGGEKRLIADEFGNLLLLVRGNEVFIYQPQKKQFGPIYDFIPMNKNWGITSISQQPGTHKYWFGLQSGGLVIYNRQTGNMSYTGHNVEMEPAIEAVGPASDFAFSFFDSKGRVWFHRWGPGHPYCMQYDPTRKEAPLRQFEFISTLKTYHELHGFMQQKNGQVGLYGTKLLAFYNEEENKFEVIPNEYRNEQGINYETVTALYEDREKNIWIATQENGLYRYNPSLQFFSNFYHPSRNGKDVGVGSVMSFIETKSGHLLTGTWEDGPFVYAAGLKKARQQIIDTSKFGKPYLWSFCASADSNTIWMGGQPGLYQYNQATQSLQYHNPAPLQNRTIRQVAEDKNGNLWLGLHAFGVFRLANPKIKNSLPTKIVETENAMINRLVVDRHNMVWAASGFDGLFLIDGNSGRVVKKWKQGNGAESEKLGNAVMALLDYDDSLMLIGSINQLFFYNRHTRQINLFPLPSSIIGNICSFEKDNDGFIWIGTTNALYRLHPKKKAMVLFNRLDGINNDRFNLSASYKMKDGRLLFGTSNSFIAFDPHSIRLSEVSSSVILTGIEVGKTELRLDSVQALDRLTLGYKDNSISFSFSSLSYAFSSLIQYKMEGIDDEWKTVEKDNKASFPFLPAGRYTLLLRTVNAEGVPYQTPTILSIRIKPPFYQTWWFYTLLGLALAFLLYWFDRQRTKRKEVLQKVRTDIANGLHDDVNTALNNINILSEIARLKSDREPGKAKEYLEQIHNKSHNMIIALDDMLWSLNPDNDAMDKTINRIKEFADALMQRHAVTIELLIDKKVEKLELNMKFRHEAFLLFKEGLRSLVEAGTGLCVVHLTLEKTKLLFTIEFENEGCDMKQLNNLLHRRDMEFRLHALKAKLDVQLHKSRSVFSLQLPFNPRD